MNSFRKIPGFEEVAHKADAALIVYGSTLPELFSHASEGMYQIMGITDKDLNKAEDIIVLQASDPESLLVSYLSELLFMAENGEKVRIIELRIKENNLIARFIKTHVIRIAKEIKAVTFNEMKINKQKDIFQTRIVFDL